MMRGLKCANVPLVSSLPNFTEFYKHLTVGGLQTTYPDVGVSVV
jgi:hypothetical protein